MNLRLASSHVWIPNQARFAGCVGNAKTNDGRGAAGLSPDGTTVLIFSSQ
jgi:hypothetical protein